MAEPPRALGAALAGRRVLVVGLGRTGLSTARYLLGAGARVRACDRREDAPLPPQADQIEVVRGHDGPELLLGIDLVVPSPGVPADAPLLAEAVRRGVPIASEIEIAAHALREPIVAVTGTNGKSTTTSLIGAMLEQAGRRVFTGGNLGTPLIEAAGGGFEVIVAEVSSFQLEWVEAFRPHVGVLLNVTDDHLDRYRDFEHYARTKARLFARQASDDVAILNRDDARVLAVADEVASDVRTFGAGWPVEPGLAHRAAALVGDSVEIDEPAGRISFSLARARLSGSHNRENLMAALLAARALGAPPAPLQATIEQFAGLRHRTERVAEIGGVAFVDDSKGTNVGATIKSLEGYADGSVVLIAGGLSKGGDYGVARAAIGRKVRCIALYGSARHALADAWRGCAEIESFERFDDAVAAARAAARPGDVVLLSPACASMDQFPNYAARGDAFAAQVRSFER